MEFSILGQYLFHGDLLNLLMYFNFYVWVYTVQLLRLPGKAVQRMLRLLGDQLLLTYCTSMDIKFEGCLSLQKNNGTVNTVCCLVNAIENHRRLIGSYLLISFGLRQLSCVKHIMYQTLICLLYAPHLPYSIKWVEMGL